jgi:hypothetical protein
VASPLPCCRYRSAALAPASACWRMLMICSSVRRLAFPFVPWLPSKGTLTHAGLISWGNVTLNIPQPDSGRVDRELWELMKQEQQPWALLRLKQRKENPARATVVTSWNWQAKQWESGLRLVDCRGRHRGQSGTGAALGVICHDRCHAKSTRRDRAWSDDPRTERRTG